MHRFHIVTCLGLIAAFGPAAAAQEKDALTRHLQGLASRNREVRRAAAWHLGAHGTAAKAAVPALGKVLRADPDAAVANQAALALAQIGWPAVDALSEAVRKGSPAAKNQALLALGRMGPQARDALDLLRDVLREGKPAERVLAASALGEMGPAAEPAIADLCQAMRDPDKKLSQAAARSLFNLGANAVPGIRDLLADELMEVRLTALQALAMLGPEARKAVPEVRQLLEDPEAPVRAWAAHTLSSMGPAARDAIPALLASMKDPDVKVQQATFLALLQIGGKEDGGGLAEALPKLNQEERWAMRGPLKQFGPALRDAVNPLIRDLQEPDEGKRLSAALALGTIGLEAREATPALQEALNDPSPLVRQSAAVSLALISKQAKGNQQFEPTAKQVRERLTRALNELPPLNSGPPSREALFDRKAQAAYNQVVDLHLLASVQLNQIGKSNPWLEKQLGLNELRRQVATALTSQFGPEAIPALLRGMHLAAYYDLGFC
jgi:HEAT repeat protein